MVSEFGFLNNKLNINITQLSGALLIKFILLLEKHRFGNENVHEHCIMIKSMRIRQMQNVFVLLHPSA